MPPPSPRVAPAPRRAAHDPTLLSLPDDVLSRIIGHLLPSLHGRALADGPPAFALATTCTRLLRLFRASLHTIDALHPALYTHPPPHFPAYTSAHLVAITRLAGRFLRALRLSPTPSATDALPGLASRCPHLHELAFSDAGAIAPTAARELFPLAASLAKLHIADPRLALHCLDSQLHLRELTLTALRHFALPAVTLFLRLSGRALISLRVGFDVPYAEAGPAGFFVAGDIIAGDGDSDGDSDGSGADVPAPPTPLSCVTELAVYFRDCASHDLPRLEVLQVESCSACSLEHGRFLDADNAPEETHANDMFRALHAKVEAAREANLYGRNETALRKVVVGATAEIVFDCVAQFDRLFGERVQVEVEYPGVAAAFPPKGAGETPFFRSLQISPSFLRNDLPSCELRRLETLNVGTSHMMNMYDRDHGVRKSVNRLVGLAAGGLRVVRVPSVMGLMSSHPYAAVADVLGAAPAVSVLEIRSDVVCDGSSNENRRLIAAMGRIRVLKLIKYGRDRRNVRRRHYPYAKPFAHGLPSFLKCLARSCRQLQCVYLEVESDAATPIPAPITEDVLMGLEAIKQFKAALPEVDIGGVEKLLNVWVGRG